MSDVWPWLAVGLLGAYHGINPAMGWLFAVALGLQERSRKALLRALPPIALGHLASVALVVTLVGFAQAVIGPQILRFAAASGLVAFGIYKFVKPRSHPRWVGMRVRLPELILWSFLMSTTHGAGLMLLPVLLRMPRPMPRASMKAMSFSGPASALSRLPEALGRPFIQPRCS